MGELKGHQWQPRELAEFNYDAGWQDAEQLVVSVAVELAESQGFDRAQNVNPDGSIDRGAWQLNSIHKAITDDIAYDIKRATTAAFRLYVARDSFDDWAAYTSGVYLHDSYLGRACVGVANFLADRFLKVPVPDHDDGTPYVHHFETPLADFRFRVGTQLYHNKQAGKALGWESASKAKVLACQVELAKGRAAARPTLPPT